MKIRYGMIGGSKDAFIGEVHRKAIRFVDNVELVSGCFSRDITKNIATGNMYQIDSKRIYDNYKIMAKKESQRLDKPDFIVIATPNNTHYEIAKTFLLEGFHIVCEKPLCFTIKEAEELEKIASEKNLLFAVTYTYTGYSMVKYMKQLILDDKIGDILNVYAEYPQDWLISAVNKNLSGPGLSIWRMNQEYTGISNAVGDIGTHIEQTVHYVTGLKLKRVLSKVNRFGHELDLNANILVEFENGVNGLYWCSQVSLGHPNGFKIRVYGTKGSLSWFQETPDYLEYSGVDGVKSLLSRGADYVYGNAIKVNKTPKGHPEGYHEAFANIYKTYIHALRKLKGNQKLEEQDLDFPTVTDGVNGVKFIHAVIKSDLEDSSWVLIK